MRAALHGMMFFALWIAGCAGRCRSPDSVVELRRALDAQNVTHAREAFARVVASRGWTLIGPLREGSVVGSVNVPGREEILMGTGDDGGPTLMYVSPRTGDGCYCGEFHCPDEPAHQLARDADGKFRVLRPVVHRTRAPTMMCGPCTQGCGTPSGDGRSGPIPRLLLLPTRVSTEVGEAVEVPITFEQVGLRCERDIPAA